MRFRVGFWEFNGLTEVNSTTIAVPFKRIVISYRCLREVFRPLTQEHIQNEGLTENASTY